MEINDGKNVSMRAMFKFVRFLMLPLLFILAGCLPTAVDDFSVLDKDVLSDLLRKSYSPVNLTPGHSPGSIGFGRIDKIKIENLAKELFLEKDRNEVKNIFLKNQGECNPSADSSEIVCSFDRKWKLKNIGGSFDTSNWADPAAKVEINFSFDDLGKARSLNLKLINITKYKVIKG